jgi:hypothetical protein
MMIVVRSVVTSRCNNVGSLAASLSDGVVKAPGLRPGVLVAGAWGVKSCTERDFSAACHESFMDSAGGLPRVIHGLGRRPATSYSWTRQAACHELFMDSAGGLSRVNHGLDYSFAAAKLCKPSTKLKFCRLACAGRLVKKWY